MARDLVEEVEELRVAVRDRMERPRREEAVLEVADGALDLALLLRLSHAAKRGLDVHASAEVEQRRMKAHGVTRALEDDRLRVVEEPLSGGSAEERGGAYERAAQGLGAHVEHELPPHRARVREHDDESPERSGRPQDHERADVSPVDLSLLARQGLDAEEHLALRGRPSLEHVPAERAQAARVAALDEHVEDAGGDEPRVTSQRLVDERDVRIEHASVGPGGAGLGAEAAEHARDRVEVDAELRRDRSALPVLGEVQAADLRLDLQTDGHRVTSQRASCRRSRKSPRPRTSRRRRRPRPSVIATATS